MQNFKILSYLLILCFFGFSILSFTINTKAEAQNFNKLPQNFKKMHKKPTIKKPPVSVFKNKKLDDKQLEAMKSLRNWDKNSPLETLIRRINDEIFNELKTAEEINRQADFIMNHDRSYVRGQHGGYIMRIMRIIWVQIGCDAPSMHGIEEPLCGSSGVYGHMFNTHWEAPFILSYRTHKQLLYCDVLPDEINLGLHQRDFDDSRYLSDYRADRTPITAIMRSKGLAFGKCFCKFGSRQGTHPGAGYENIVPDIFSDVCPL